MAEFKNHYEHSGASFDHRLNLNLPEEQIVKLVVSNGISAHMACSPHDLEDLAAGWLYCQEMIDCIDDIVSLQICDYNSRILAQIKPNGHFESNSFQPVTTSGCSGGIIALNRFHTVPHRCESQKRINLAAMRRLNSKMLELLQHQGAGRGVHCAALANGDDHRELLMACDIGRHNAVDKTIGMGLRLKADFGEMILTTSGRISSEMILKAIRAGIPIVATLRSTTSLAAELATEAGITICCHLNKDAPLILGKSDRIID